jgi:hypothetical protein
MPKMPPIHGANPGMQGGPIEGKKQYLKKLKINQGGSVDLTNQGKEGFGRY